MENNEINKSNNDTPVSAEKKHKTHLAISLAIIAAALVIAAIVAIVAVVGNIVSSDGLSLDGTKLNGQTASELYEGIESGLANSANYTISLTKHGIAAANLMIEDTSESLSIVPILKKNANRSTILPTRSRPTRPPKRMTILDISDEISQIITFQPEYDKQLLYTSIISPTYPHLA